MPFLVLLLLTLGLWGRLSAQIKADERPQAVWTYLDDRPAKHPFVIVDSINFEGLRRTRPERVRYEMSISFGDTIPYDTLQAVLQRNQELLYNTGLFNQVHVQGFITQGLLRLKIDVSERWYIFPELYFQVEERTIQDWLRDPDFDRLTYGVGLNWRNVTGRNDQLRLRWTEGFSQRYEISYSQPFVWPKARIGMGFSASYRAQREVIYGSDSGLVARYRNPDEAILRTTSFSIFASKRITQYDFFSAVLRFDDLRIADTLYAFNEDYLTQTDGREQLLSLAVQYTSDTRDVRPFPLKGQIFTVSATYFGLPPLSTSEFLKADARFFYYTPLGNEEQTRWFAAFGARMQALIGREVPFAYKFFLSQAGLRGFDSFIVDGSLISVAKSELRFALMRRKIYKVDWGVLPRQFREFPLGLYPFLFADIGTVSDYTLTPGDPTYKEKLLAGYGIGLDVPYFYDNVFRVTAALNNYGQFTWLINFSVALR